MAYRVEEVKTYKNIVICDDCGKESLLWETNDTPMGFDNKMNRTIGIGYTFKNENGTFKNYCGECQKKHS